MEGGVGRMTEEEIQSEIKRADDLAVRILARRPADQDLLEVRRALKNAKEMVAGHWPLLPEDRKKINIGLYAVRVLEGGPYDELPDALMVLNSHLKDTTS
jgi:hypothetical protein